MKSTELNLIPIFVAIFEERSLSKAARRLEISQPAVSKALARLRELYNEPLFHRTPSGVDPTNFATDIYPALSASLKNFTSTLSATAEFDPKKSSRVYTIACNSLVSYTLIPELMRNIESSAPNIVIEVHPLFTEDYEADLRLQRYDLVIDRAPVDHSNLRHKVIHQEKLLMVCSDTHPRIGASVEMDAILNEQHVVSSTWQSRQTLLGERELASLVNRQIRCSAAGVAEILGVIQGSEYIGLTTESMYRKFASHYQLRSFSSPIDDLQVDVSLIWHPSRTNEAGHRWLRQELEKASQKVFSDL